MKKKYEKPIFIKTMYISIDSMANGENTTVSHIEDTVFYPEYSTNPVYCSCEKCPDSCC